MSASVVRLVLVWIGLMALLAMTVALAFLPLGPFKAAVAYAIATAKAVLIVWFFMEMRREGPIARLATVAAFVWLAIMVTLTASDYLTRGLIGN